MKQSKRTKYIKYMLEQIFAKCKVHTDTRYLVSENSSPVSFWISFRFHHLLFLPQPPESGVLKLTHFSNNKHYFLFRHICKVLGTAQNTSPKENHQWHIMVQIIPLTSEAYFTLSTPTFFPS